MNRLRVVELLLPTLLPARVICEEPFEAVLPEMTMAPIGLPVTQPGMSTGTIPSK